LKELTGAEKQHPTCRQMPGDEKPEWMLQEAVGENPGDIEHIFCDLLIMSDHSSY
jgi:hypothetical protein